MKQTTVFEQQDFKSCYDKGCMLVSHSFRDEQDIWKCEGHQDPTNPDTKYCEEAINKKYFI